MRELNTDKLLRDFAPQNQQTYDDNSQYTNYDELNPSKVYKAVVAITNEIPAELYVYENNVSTVYDNAVAAILYSVNREQDKAVSLLNTIAYLMKVKDQPIEAPGFDFNTVENDEGDLKYNRLNKKSGAIAWVGYAMCYYQYIYKDTQFQDCIIAIADYFVSIAIGITTIGYYKVIPLTAGFNGMSTEHNIDCYFFLSMLRKIGINDYEDLCTKLTGGLTNTFFWVDELDSEPAHFVTGFRFAEPDEGTGIRRNYDKSLDVNSWGSLFLMDAYPDDVGIRTMVDNIFEYIKTNFEVGYTGLDGNAHTAWKPYNGIVTETTESDYDWTDSQMVWSEGSYGVLLAAARYQLYIKQNADEILSLRNNSDNLASYMTGYLDLIKYTDTGEDGFSADASAAGTNWMYLFEAFAVYGNLDFMNTTGKFQLGNVVISDESVSVTAES